MLSYSRTRIGMIGWWLVKIWSLYSTITKVFDSHLSLETLMATWLWRGHKGLFGPMDYWILSILRYSYLSLCWITGNLHGNSNYLKQRNYKSHMGDEFSGCGCSFHSSYAPNIQATIEYTSKDWNIYHTLSRGVQKPGCINKSNLINFQLF